jgi:enoyl-CoA hydratase/carnithine racemase
MSTFVETQKNNSLTTPTVRLERLDEGAIAVLTLDDQARANAMSPEMGDAFKSHIHSIKDDPSLRAVVIRGAGKDFSIGGHRDMLIRLGSGEIPGDKLHDFMLAFYDRWLPMLEIPVPVISALQGDCIGVAPVFACAPDIAIADETLNLQITFANLNFYPGMALASLLARKVGPGRTALLAVAGEIVNGREAERLGLVERCVPAGKAYDEALRIARQVATAAPSTVRLLKKNFGLKKSDLAADLEQNAAQQAKDLQTAEYRERVANYLPDHYA